MLAALIGDVVVNPPTPSSGVTWSSAIVFAGGLIAALGAVVAAVLTASAAERRLERTLVAERERSDIRQQAEAERVERQLAHERLLARRAEASSAIEQAARLLTSSAYKILLCTNSYLNGEGPGEVAFRELELDLHRLGEESDIVALRFGSEAEVADAVDRMTKALNAALPSSDELPFSDGRRQELVTAEKEVYDASENFLAVARDAIDNYA